MRRTLALLAAALLLAASTTPSRADVGVANFINIGCQLTYAQAHGCFITTMQGPGAPGPLARGNKVGRACAWNLLSLVASGDMRIATAMKNGGITQISSVDYEAFELVPFFYGYGRWCTVVSGE